MQKLIKFLDEWKYLKQEAIILLNSIKNSYSTIDIIYNSPKRHELYPIVVSKTRYINDLVSDLHKYLKMLGKIANNAKSFHLALKQNNCRNYDFLEASEIYSIFKQNLFRMEQSLIDFRMENIVQILNVWENERETQFYDYVEEKYNLLGGF
jgi:hypothetical protein